jgi:hypothetical protein
VIEIYFNSSQGVACSWVLTPSCRQFAMGFMYASSREVGHIATEALTAHLPV